VPEFAQETFIWETTYPTQKTETRSNFQSCKMFHLDAFPHPLDNGCAAAHTASVPRSPSTKIKHLTARAFDAS